MVETFYSTLGVDDDADVQTIRRAYRELVKQVHPDVSDDPDASAQFQRLTTARDTLTDSDERRRYDRLGHESYVAQHVSADVWTTSPADSADSATARPSPSDTDTSRQRTGSGGDYDRTTWLGDAGGPTKAERTATSTYRKRQQRRRHKRATSTATSNEDWQYASETYRSADSTAAERQSGLRSAVRLVRDVGPWLVIHVVFILSAIATAWVTLVQVQNQMALSLPVILFGGVVLAMVIFVSVVHVMLQAYA